MTPPPSYPLPRTSDKSTVRYTRQWLADFVLDCMVEEIIEQVEGTEAAGTRRPQSPSPPQKRTVQDLAPAVTPPGDRVAEQVRGPRMIDIFESDSPGGTTAYDRPLPGRLLPSDKAAAAKPKMLFGDA